MTRRFERLQIRAERRNPCRYANAATDYNMKYAGNILPRRLPNWCLGKYLYNKKIYPKHYRGPCYVLNGIINLQRGIYTHGLLQEQYMLGFTFAVDFSVLTITR